MGWGGFLDKIMDKLPIQGRIERIKNEKAKLLREKGEIEKLNLRIDNEKDRKIAGRYRIVCNRINELSGLLENKS